MTIRNLEHLFRPRSLAVFGASDRPGSVGATVMRNLLAEHFAGAIMPVNPKHPQIAGRPAWPDVASLPETPDLAVICTPAAAVPGIIAQLGERGTRAAVVLTSGLGSTEPDGRSLQQAMLDAARPHLLRILGPNCVGLMVPGMRLNASFAHVAAPTGHIAFVAQSGALTTAVLDWARTRGIGFSHFISLGDAADVDFGDVIDWLASDGQTRAILLYIESVRAARKFVSAARAAARNMPVIAIKAGRVPEGAKAAASHTGALAGADDVFDAAIRRAGMLRVYSTEALFDAVETLARARRCAGDRLAILTNGGGPGVMATDELVLSGGRLAQLSETTLRRLDELLPRTWSRGNPVDIIGDAPVERYIAALHALSEDSGVDAVLVLHAPTAIVPSVEIAHAVAQANGQIRPTLLTCFLGGEGVAAARRVFDEAGIPRYESPEDAVGAFLQLVNYRRNQELLMQTPRALPMQLADRERARGAVETVLAEGRRMLTEPEAKALLAAYGIPVVETHCAANADEAARLAAQIGFPVALKILSPDVTHKSDVGGVALGLATADAVREAGTAMLGRVGALRPQAHIEGFSVQRMAGKPGASELIVGVASDPVFGPVVLFGQGGTAVEVIGDRAVGLPPLNDVLAEDMIGRTRVARLLAGYRDRPAADRAAIRDVLVRISQLVCELPEVSELDINPLLADHEGVIALDARVALSPPARPGVERLAIRPYPAELEETVLWRGRKITLQPIRPEDEPEHAAFFARLDADDIALRFFGATRTFDHARLARFTQVDYDREMAFIATASAAGGRAETLGVARAVSDPDNDAAEFAVIVRSDLKGQGLGRLLMDKIVRYCRARGLRELNGDVLARNTAMLALARSLGFSRALAVEEGSVRVRLSLRAAVPATKDQPPTA